MISKLLALCFRLLCGLSILASTGCVVKRTVTEGGSVVSQKYRVERPLRDALLEKEEER